MAQKKYIKWVVLLILTSMLIGGSLYYLWRPKNKFTHRAVQSIVIAKGDLEEVITAQGKLEPSNYVEVGAQVSGQLKNLLVHIGDKVARGKLLAEIDSKLLAARVQADEARLKTLKAQLTEQHAQAELANRQYQRHKSLIKTHTISQEILESSKTDVLIAQAKLTALRAQIDEAQSTLSGNKTNLGYTKIYAPITGTVVEQTARVGQTLNASQTAPNILKIADLDLMTVRAQVAEADITRLFVGMPVYFTTFGSGGRKWQSTIRQILPSPETINDVVLYNVLIDIENADKKLLTGMSAQIFFVAGQAKHVPLIPIAALGKHLAERDSQKGVAYQVHVKNGTQTLSKIIHVGLQTRTMAEIKEGLKEGDEVLMGLVSKNTATSSDKQFNHRIRGSVL